MNRFRYDGQTALQMPAQYDLRRCLFVFRSQFQKKRFAEIFSFSKRSPRFRHNALLLAKCHSLRLLKTRIAFDLIHRRADICFRKQFLQMRRLEVADTDRPDLSGFIQPLQHFPGFRHLAKRPMQVIQINVIQSQRFKALIKCLLLPPATHIRIPDLRCNKQLLARNPAGADACSDILLIVIVHRCINPAVSRFHCTGKRFFCLRSAHLPETKTDAVHFDSII